MSDVRGLSEARRKLAALGPAVADAVKAEVMRSALRIQGDARLRVPVDTGRLRSSIAIAPIHDGIGARIGTNVVYATAIEYGLPPGTRPNIASLSGWVRRKLGIHDPDRARWVAYLIARKIERYGTTAQPYLHPAAEEERPHFRRRLNRSVERAIRDTARA